MEDIVVEGLAKLMQAVETIAPAAWAVLVKQGVVTGWANLAGATPFVILVGLFAYSARLVWRKEDKDYEANTIFLIFLATVCVGFAIALIGMAISDLFNPEYWAIRKLLELAK